MGSNMIRALYFVLVTSAIAGFAEIGLWAPLLLGGVFYLTASEDHLREWHSMKRTIEHPLLLQYWLFTVGLAIASTATAYTAGAAVRLIFDFA